MHADSPLPLQTREREISAGGKGRDAASLPEASKPFSPGTQPLRMCFECAMPFGKQTRYRVGSSSPWQSCKRMNAGVPSQQAGTTYRSAGKLTVVQRGRRDLAYRRAEVSTRCCYPPQVRVRWASEKGRSIFRDLSFATRHPAGPVPSYLYLYCCLPRLQLATDRVSHPIGGEGGKSIFLFPAHWPTGKASWLAFFVTRLFGSTTPHPHLIALSAIGI